jgi:hypothetical protein
MAPEPSAAPKAPSDEDDQERLAAEAPLLAPLYDLVRQWWAQREITSGGKDKPDSRYQLHPELQE